MGIRTELNRNTASNNKFVIGDADTVPHSVHFTLTCTIQTKDKNTHLPGAQKAPEIAKKPSHFSNPKEPAWNRRYFFCV